MSSEALALVLAAAVLHATWNLAAKGVTGDRVGFIWLYAVASALVWVHLGVAWVVLTGETPRWTWLAAGAVSSLLHLGYQLVLQRGYAEGDLNLVYPLARGSGPMLTFVVAGVLLISFGRSHGHTRAARRGPRGAWPARSWCWSASA